MFVFVIGRYAPTLDDDEEPLAVDADCQTPVHFVEKHIDNKYEFSEWQLRRRALELANLRTKRTHSTQTTASQFRRETETQTWLPRYALSLYYE